jgi:hypothetical protein
MIASRSSSRRWSLTHSVREHHTYKPLPYARRTDDQARLFYTNLALAFGFAVIGLIATVIYLILGIPTALVTPLG